MRTLVVQDKGNVHNGFISHCPIAGYRVNTVCYDDNRNEILAK